MKISRDWLQTYFDKPLPSVQELGDALTFHAFEIESIEGDVLDVKITPNRGHDALSHRGIAKEISAILNIPLTNDPLQEVPKLEPVTDKVSVLINVPELCARHINGLIRGVKVGPSPEWLQKRLESIGQRSINNIVDATNFVMFDIGQPLHAFDASKLAKRDGKYLATVREAHEGERIITLDGKEHTLNPSMLVIADAEDRPLDIAGVKGGKFAELDENTVDIVLEAANFYGPSVRKTAKALNLRTDASQRFEQVISPELAAYGIRAATDLILKLAGGDLVGFADAYPKPHVPVPVVLHATHPSKALGVDISKETIRDSFTRLGLPFEEKGDEFIVTPPFERLDITIPEDLIEEIGRLIGYEKIEAKELPAFEKPLEIDQNFAASERVREDFIAKGYSEVYTSVFAGTGVRQVLNKVGGGKSYLRANLVDGLTEAFERNKASKDLLGLKEIKLFEIGAVWSPGGEEEIVVGTINEKEGAQEQGLKNYLQNAPQYGSMPLSQTEWYQTFSRYPSITRDIALWVPSDTKSDEVKEVISKSAEDLMLRIDLFDEFKKETQVSYAFRLVFQSFEKTLTDNEANAAMEHVYETVKSKGWTVR